MDIIAVTEKQLAHFEQPPNSILIRAKNKYDSFSYWLSNVDPEQICHRIYQSNYEEYDMQAVQIFLNEQGVDAHDIFDCALNTLTKLSNYNSLKTVYEYLSTNRYDAVLYISMPWFYVDIKTNSAMLCATDTYMLFKDVDEETTAVVQLMG